MIAGIGVDLMDIARIQELLDKPSAEHFLERVLTAAERVLAEQKTGRLAEYVAGRFAAKESVAKALGTGIGAAVGFHDIEVVHDSSGRPICTVNPEALVRAGFDPSVTIHVTITHSEHTAAAFAVLEHV